MWRLSHQVWLTSEELQPWGTGSRLPPWPNWPAWPAWPTWPTWRTRSTWSTWSTWSTGPTWRRTLWQPTSWHPASHSTARISQAQTQSSMNGKQASGPSPPRHNFDQSQPGRGRRSQFRPIWGSRGGEGGGGEHLWVKVLGRGWISFPLSWWVGPSLVTNLRISFNALQLLKKHCQRHNGLKALSTLTYPTPPILP